MISLTLFINSFLSYLMVFVFIAVLVVAACILGVKWKKSSEAKNAGKIAEPVTMGGADKEER